MVSERNATYKLVEEVSQFSGKPLFWVYRRKSAPGLLWPSTYWSPDKCFDTLEEAEQYVENLVAYKRSVENPKLVKYY